MRIGLVLGAGGVVGASWLIGALEALGAETGWDPREAEYIVGTSAGSVVGGLCAAGIPAELMVAYIAGRPLAEFAEAEGLEKAVVEDLEQTARRSTGSEYRLALALPLVGPGSWRMALSTLMHARQHSPGTVITGWLPRGFISTDPIRELVERFISDPWPEHPNYWAVACDYHSGKRVAFGHPGAPAATVGEAVAASCATAACVPPRTSTCSATATSTWSSA
jgi:NTE family protein